jgi:hypothetical protein
VCISTSVYVYVFATGHIVIHSLLVDGDGSLEIGETDGAPTPSTFDVTSLVDNEGSIGLYHSTLESPEITSVNLVGNGPAESGGTSAVTSADFDNTGVVTSEEGTLTFTDPLPQLSDGTLSGGDWAAIGDTGTVLDLPEAVTNLSGGSIGIINGGQVTAGVSSAVARLHAIGSGASLDIAGNATPVSVGNDLSSSGDLSLGDYDSSGAIAINGYYFDDSGGETTLAGGSTLQATGVDIDSGGSLTGGDQATVDANVDNAGAIGVDATVMKIDGQYVQTGTLEAGDGFELQVSSYVELSGALDTAVGVPPPSPGTRSTALTFASSDGGFTSHSIGFRVVPEATQVDVVAQPQVELSPTTAAPGGAVSVSGGDFPYESTVDLYLDDASGTPLQSATTDVHGFFQTTVTVPAGTARGRHHVVAVDGSLTVIAPLHVT